MPKEVHVCILDYFRLWCTLSFWREKLPWDANFHPQLREKNNPLLKGWFFPPWKCVELCQKKAGWHLRHHTVQPMWSTPGWYSMASLGKLTHPPNQMDPCRISVVSTKCLCSSSHDLTPSSITTAMERTTHPKWTGLIKYEAWCFMKQQIIWLIYHYSHQFQLQPVSRQCTGVGIDFSTSDASVQNWLIDHGFKVLRKNIQFPDPMAERTFWYSWEFFKNTPVVMPDRNMWLVRGGVPSGSHFTLMIDSIVNHVMITWI